MLRTTYKTAWYMLTRIRVAMGQRDKTHWLNGIIEFDDTNFGGPTVGKKRDWGTEKAKVFVAVPLDERGNPLYTKMRITQNIEWASVKKFAQVAFVQGSTIRSDGYGSYIRALEGYIHEHKPYDPNSGLLHWLYIVRSSWVLTMARLKSTSKPILTNIAFASAAMTLASLSGASGLSCWYFCSAELKG